VYIRVYVVETTPAQIIERLTSLGYAAASKISKEATKRSSVTEEWHRGTLKYSVWYEDYGGLAAVDVFAKACGRRTVALAFMYDADDKANRKQVEDIVGSFKCSH
jgi:hypothetical protein